MELTYDYAIKQLNRHIQYHHEVVEKLKEENRKLLEKYVDLVDKYTEGEERRRLLE